MAIGFYKVLELPETLEPSSIYYVVESLDDDSVGEDVLIHRLFVTTKTTPVEAIPLNAVTKNEFTTELAKKFASPKGTIEQYVRGDGSLGNIENVGLNPLSVLYVEQDITLEQQAQARENIGTTISFYDQKWIWDAITNPEKEFSLDFIPIQTVWTYDTNTPIWMDDGDFEITGATLKINTDLKNGAIIRYGYYHGDTTI